MTLEALINEIIDADKQINADIGVINLVESEHASNRIGAYENRIADLAEVQDKLIRKLAAKVIKQYTGYKLSE